MAALQVAGNPMMRDVSAPGRYARNLTFAQFLKSLGSISGPYLTTLVVAMGLAWYRIFPIFAAVTLVTLLLALLLSVPESEGEDRPASVSASFALLKEPSVALAVLGIFLYVGAEVGLNSWLATFLSRSFGMDLASSATRLGPGLFFIALSAGRLLGSLVLNYLDARRFFRLSALLGLAGLGLLFAGHRSAALAGIVLCGLGFANIWPLVFALTIERRPERSGALSGLMCMAIFGGAALPALMGLAADRGGVRLAFLVPLACFAYLTALAFLGRRRRALPHDRRQPLGERPARRPDTRRRRDELPFLGHRGQSRGRARLEAAFPRRRSRRVPGADRRGLFPRAGGGGRGGRLSPLPSRVPRTTRRE